MMCGMFTEIYEIIMINVVLNCWFEHLWICVRVCSNGFGKNICGNVFDCVENVNLWKCVRLCCYRVISWKVEEEMAGGHGT